MNIKKKLALITLSLSLLGVTTTTFAVEHLGGVWSYGGHHDPSNWGAFSNFYHRTRNHWSEVVRDRDSSASNASAGPMQTSKAFINTNFGEKAYYSAGLN